MEIERGVDRFANALRGVDKVMIETPRKYGFIMDRRMADLVLFALDDLQRQIDELKEERR